MTALLDIRNLKVDFHTDDGVVQAVDGISYTVDAGETVAIVGESGSGKSVSAMTVMGLLEGTSAKITGEVFFEGKNLLEMEYENLREIRGAKIAMVFQEPMTSLNPLLTIGAQLCEGMKEHLGLNQSEALARAEMLLSKVGISEPQRRLSQYPHHFSGGMRQRVMIAIALSCNPKLIIADEPTTALDVTIQAQILQLMKDLTAELGMALILITHNLGIVARYATKVNVMYAGRVVESSATQDLFARPKHPYTLGLLTSIPRLNQLSDERLIPIEGAPPDLSRLADGCAFRPRCRYAEDRCTKSKPALEVVFKGHETACFQSANL